MAWNLNNGVENSFSPFPSRPDPCSVPGPTPGPLPPPPPGRELSRQQKMQYVLKKNRLDLKEDEDMTHLNYSIHKVPVVAQIGNA